MFDPPMFDLQGHRGARGLFPENTLEGFAAARGLGLRSFEIDIGITRDGVPVVHHDPALNPDITRGPDGAWLEQRGPLLRDLSVRELAGYDVGRIGPGTTYAATYHSQAPRDGAGIPTLEAVLRADPATRFNIELKLMPDHPDWTVSAEEMADRVLHVVDREGAADRVTIQSFDWRAPRHVRRVRPDIATGWLTRAETVRAAPLWRGDADASTRMDLVPDAIAAEGGGTWTPFHAELTLGLLGRAHDLRLKVIPWTVNDPDDMRRLMAWGADGLITDWPDRALILLRDRRSLPGKRPPDQNPGVAF
jgi:glycerophosphoryl diester phosphodiesterase